MATLRRRTLKSGKIVWQADYADGAGTRRHKQFTTKREADAFLTQVKLEVTAGAHIPDRAASTVEQAYQKLITALKGDGAAPATLYNYQVYYSRHVGPFLGTRLLPKLHPADVADWLDQLRDEGRTADTCRRARIVLGALFDEAIRRRLAYSNPVRALRRRRLARRVKIRAAEETVRIPERDVVGRLLLAAGDTETLSLVAREPQRTGLRTVDTLQVPAVHPIRAMRQFRIAHPDCVLSQFRPTPWLRPLLATLALAGLRIGEARGLRWRAIGSHAIAVREAVDRYDTVGTVKTVAALRDVPLGPLLAAMLADWRPPNAAPEDFVFPSEEGTPRGYPNIANRQIAPLQIALGVTAADGSPRWTAHSFRHFAVSLWIDEGASLKQVAEWAGHESPEFTQRVYGHLFEKGRRDMRAVIAGERSVLGDLGLATPLQHAAPSEPKKLMGPKP